MVYPLGEGALAGAGLEREAVEVRAPVVGEVAGGEGGARKGRLRPSATVRERSEGDVGFGRGAAAGAPRTVAGMCLAAVLAVAPRRGETA